jgi:hypothetical protein
MKTRKARRRGYVRVTRVVARLTPRDRLKAARKLRGMWANKDTSFFDRREYA